LVSDIKEHRLRVLRSIFGTKKDEMTEGLEKLHNEEPHNFELFPKYN
jgi:hypothetical protein